MSLNYVIFQNPSTTETSQNKNLEVVIGTEDHRALIGTKDTTIVSAGTVSFKGGPGNRIMADVTHGSLLLRIPVDVNRMSIDKGIIEENFL